jgi:hypothetical protein
MHGRQRGLVQLCPPLSRDETQTKGTNQLHGRQRGLVQHCPPLSRDETQTKGTNQLHGRQRGLVQHCPPLSGDAARARVACKPKEPTSGPALLAKRTTLTPIDTLILASHYSELCKCAGLGTQTPTRGLGHDIRVLQRENVCPRATKSIQTGCCRGSVGMIQCCSNDAMLMHVART